MYKKIFYVLIVCGLLLNCSSSKNIFRGDFKSYYESEVLPLNPDFKLHHVGAKNYKLFFQFSSDELLYERNLDNNELFADIGISATKYNGFSLSTRIDSVNTRISDQRVGELKRIIAGSVNIPFKLNHQQIIQTDYKDYVRGYKNKTYLAVDSSYNASSNYLLQRKADGLPLLGNYIESGNSAQISSPYFQSEEIKASFYNSEFELPAPPFSLRRPKKFNIEPLDVRFFRKNNEGKYEVDFYNNSMVRIQDNNYLGDYTVLKFYNGFPKVSTYEQMIEVIRYITSKDEYAELLSATDKKAALDKFWLERSGSEERAKKIIRYYYQRAEYANKYFSCHTEGWKTDRGLIFIIFGEPKSISKSLDSEIWLYGEHGKYNAINFRFVKSENPFSDNDFRLVRSEDYKPVWYYFVDAWRGGRIIN